MTPDLDTLLLSRHSRIFPAGALPPRSGVGNGWFYLLDSLCERLQFWTDHNGAPQLLAAQVKEKFAGLSFYVQCANREERIAGEQHGMIRMAGAVSLHTCEVCGGPGWQVIESGWYRARCAAHEHRHVADPIPVLYAFAGQGSAHLIGQIVIGGTPVTALAEMDAASLLAAAKREGYDQLQVVRVRNLDELPVRISA